MSDSGALVGKLVAVAKAAQELRVAIERSIDWSAWDVDTSEFDAEFRALAAALDALEGK